MKKYALSIIAASLLVGCSTRKDTFTNRNYHKMTSWYNGLFNAEEELTKKSKEIKESYTEDYSEILPVGVNYYSPKDEGETADGFRLNQSISSFDDDGGGSIGGGGSANSNVTKPTGYQAVEAKANKMIEKHSMEIRGQEKNKMMAKAYLLIGKSRFYNNNYFGSLDALNYVTKNFKSSKYYNEALLYQTLADLKGGNYFEGQEKLIQMYDRKDQKKDVQFLVASNYADFLIENEFYEESIEPLQRALNLSPNKETKSRILFSLGQVYSKLGKQQEAGEAFTAVYKSRPGFDMEVKSQLAIAQNFDPKTNNYNSYKTHLLDQSKKGIYTSKKNEFYYAIGEMALRDQKLDEAVKYTDLALKEKVSDPFIRAKTYENRANIEFKKGNYLYASTYYDSAVTSFTKEKDKKRIQEKNDVLKKLMQMHYLVQKNDSILKIAKMSREEQNTHFANYIEQLKKDEEAKLKKDTEQVSEFQLANKTTSFASSFDQSNSNKFYFYNQGLKNSGMQEFQRIWNTTTLKDNWRNSSNPGSSQLEKVEAELKGTLVAGDPRRFEINYYLEKIPRNTKDLNELKITRDTTQLALGTGYYDYFDDQKLANTTLENLLASIPKLKDTEVQALYQLYRINKDRDKNLEDKYKNEILTKFPNSIYAGFILNPEVDFITAETKEALAAYEETYNLYKEEKYEEVKQKVASAITKYPTEIIMAKFALLNAFAVSKTESKENFIQALEIVVLAYDKTDEAKLAKQLLDRLKNISQPSAEPTKDPKSTVNEIDNEDEERQNTPSVNPLGNIEENFRVKPSEKQKEEKSSTTVEWENN